MRFQQINRQDAERVFVAVKNVTGASVSPGQVLVDDVSAPDGVRCSKPATATLSLCRGVVNSGVDGNTNIANGDYGEVQAYGYRSQAYVTNTTNQAIAAGDILIPVDAAFHLARSGASDGKSGFVFAGEAVATATTPAAALVKVFIRAL